MSMQFVVPQFIEVESKVIGPISVRQFIILLLTAVVIFVIWEIFSFWIAAILGIFSLAVGGTFAFVRINGQAFHIFLLSFIQTLKNPKLKVWERITPDVLHAKIKEPKVKPVAPIPVKESVSSSRLSELSLMVDTGGIYEEEKKNK